MAEMKVFVINLDEQEKDTGCAWFTGYRTKRVDG